MLKTIISWALYYFGDLCCKFHCWNLYQWAMRNSVELDVNYKVWKKVDESKIPSGPYCYDKNGGCPYYVHSHSEDDYCKYMNIDILDEIKKCGINEDHLK